MQSDFLALAAKVLNNFLANNWAFCFHLKFVYILLFFAAVLIPFSLAPSMHPTTAVPDNDYEHFVGWWETALIFLIFVAQ